MKVVKSKNEKNELANKEVGKIKQGCTAYKNFANWDDVVAQHDGRFNRKVKARKELVESMKKIGFKGAILVVRTKAFDGTYRLYILDGQHRLDAAQELRIKFNYEVMQLLDDTQENVIALMKEFNQTSRRWVNETYLKNFMALGKREYIVFGKELAEKVFQPTDLQYIFDISIKEFRSGKMKFKNEKESMSLLESMKKIVKHLPRFAYCRRSIFQILKKTQVNHKLLAELILSEVKAMAKECRFFQADEKLFKAEIVALVNANKRLLKMAA